MEELIEAHKTLKEKGLSMRCEPHSEPCCAICTKILTSYIEELRQEDHAFRNEVQVKYAKDELTIRELKKELTELKTQKRIQCVT